MKHALRPLNEQAVVITGASSGISPAPALGDNMAAKQASRQQYDEPPRAREGALHRPSEATRVVAQTHGAGGRT